MLCSEWVEEKEYGGNNDNEERGEKEHEEKGCLTEEKGYHEKGKEARHKRAGLPQGEASCASGDALAYKIG